MANELISHPIINILLSVAYKRLTEKNIPTSGQVDNFVILKI